MVDAYGSKSAGKYIKHKGVKNVGLHFCLVRASIDGKTPRGKDYDEILSNWPEGKLRKAFDEEIVIFKDLTGFIPKHVIGHKQISLHPKLIKHIADYCIRNNCYARKEIVHETLKSSTGKDDINLGRTVDQIFAFHYGSPKNMYRAYKKDVMSAKKKGLKSIEILFHPGYADEFEKKHTSFIQERIDDINFLMSDFFKKLIHEEQLALVPSLEI